MYTSAAKSARANRNSVFTQSNTQAIVSLRAKIKSLGSGSTDMDPFAYGVEIVPEHIVMFDKSKLVRRAYLIENKYKIGWVVDSDLNNCMICWKEFAWYRGRTKHHCRACGALVCSDCSPFLTYIPVLNEERGSRVCTNCFGLKPGIFTPLAGGEGNESLPLPSQTDSTAVNLFASPMGGGGVTANSKNTQQTTGQGNNNNNNKAQRKKSFKESEERMVQKYLEEMERIDQEQLPRYEEAYRIMREIIPLDIYKTKETRLMKRGLPEEAIKRIWNTKILWLIVTHADDVKKVRILKTFLSWNFLITFSFLFFVFVCRFI